MTYLGTEIKCDLETGTTTPLQHSYDNLTSARSNFDDGRPASTPMPMGTNPDIAIAIVKGVDLFGQPPQISSDKSRGKGISWIYPKKHPEGTTYADAVKQNLRGLEAHQFGQ